MVPPWFPALGPWTTVNAGGTPEPTGREHPAGAEPHLWRPCRRPVRWLQDRGDQARSAHSCPSLAGREVFSQQQSCVDGQVVGRDGGLHRSLGAREDQSVSVLSLPVRAAGWTGRDRHVRALGGKPRSSSPPKPSTPPKLCPPCRPTYPLGQSPPTSDAPGVPSCRSLWLSFHRWCIFQALSWSEAAWWVLEVEVRGRPELGPDPPG